VLERTGSVKIPEIVVRWWNPGNKEIEEKNLPAVDISVAANPDYRPATGLPGVPSSTSEEIKNAVAAALDWLRSNIALLTLAAIAFYLLVLAARRFWSALAVKWNQWRETSRQSEARFFGDFRRACHSADNDAIISSFWKWLDRLTPADKAASLEQIATASGDIGFLEFARRALSGRYGTATGEPSSGPDILRQVTRFRRQIRSYKGATHGSRRTLNPRSCRGSC